MQSFRTERDRTHRVSSCDFDNAIDLQLNSTDAPDTPLQKADITFAAFMKQHLQTEVPHLLKQNLEGSTVTKLNFDAVGDIISACIDSALQQYTVQSRAGTPPATIIHSETESKLRPSIPMFPNPHSPLPANAGDFRLFLETPNLTCSPRHIADDNPTPYSSASRTSTVTFIDTPYSAGDVSTSDGECLSQSWSDMPHLGMDLLPMPFVDMFSDPENPDIKLDAGYQVNVDPFDFNFASLADRPGVFTGSDQAQNRH